MKHFDIRNIKTGMLVRTRDKVLRLVIGNSLISADTGGLALSKYNKDLTYSRRADNNRDIIEIYNEPMKEDDTGLSSSITFWLKHENFLRYTELIWKREE